MRSYDGFPESWRWERFLHGFQPSIASAGRPPAGTSRQASGRPKTPGGTPSDGRADPPRTALASRREGEMRAASWLHRARPIVLAATLAFPSLAAAGAIRGTLEVPAVVPAMALHPYPGRAGSMMSAPSHPGAVTDAVLYIEKLPDSVPVRPPTGRSPELGQRDQSFVPRVLVIEKGTVVAFPNHDPIFHNVFSVSPTKRFDLGKYPRGQSRSVRFVKTGLVNVYCDIHSDMAAFIYVVPHQFFAQPSPDGSFALPALPPGSYELHVWHPDFGDLRRDIEVPAHGDASVDLRY